MRVIHVVGARPNFMKMAPVKKRMDAFPSRFEQVVVHTGQHYDDNMSEVFFRDLDLSEPDINLGVGSGSHAWQVANVMMKFEDLANELKPDLVCVVGDVNATLACALVCAKLGVRLAHIEAGLRSGDRTMPEEINRLLTDQVSDYLFTPSSDGDANLAREGVAAEKVHLVGNVMVDSLVVALPKIEARRASLSERFRLDRYALVTLHRPANVDVREGLVAMARGLCELAAEIPLIFPVHPRTQAKLAEFGQLETMQASGIQMCEPLGYIDFIALQKGADFILTDSGGIQEESTYLGIPCITLRDDTERPVTISHGTNILIGKCPEALPKSVARALDEIRRRPLQRPDLWDGKAAERIVDVLARC